MRLQDYAATNFDRTERPQAMPAGWLQDITWSGSLCVQQYAFAPMDPSTAAAWRDLYIGTVGAGASLTGLTFVAIALDPHQIERTPLLRLRAANAVWCFVSVVFIGVAVLTPRPFAAVAAMAVGVGGLAGAVLLAFRTVRQRVF